MNILRRSLAASFHAAHSAMIVGAAALALGAFTAGQAQAQGVLCDGNTIEVSFGEPLDINVNFYSTISWVSGAPSSNVLVTAINGVPQVPGLGIVPAFIYRNRQPGSVTVTNNFTDGDAIVRCSQGTPPTSDRPPLSTPASTSASLQSSATNAAITKVMLARFGKGRDLSASNNGILVSTRGLDAAADSLGEPELNAWVSGEGRSFSGEQTGQNLNLTVGLDRFVTSDFLLGGYVGIGVQSLTAAGTTTDTQSPVLGVYAARRFGDDMFVSGFVGLARPEYKVGSDSAMSKRVMAGLSLTGEFELGMVRLQSSASVLASQEDVPAFGGSSADKLESLQGKLDLRAEPLARFENGVLPYISLAAEVNRQSFNAGEENFTKPRLGLGGDMALGKGTLRFDLDYGFVAQDTNDLGAKLTYNFAF